MKEHPSQQELESGDIKRKADDTQLLNELFHNAKRLSRDSKRSELHYFYYMTLAEFISRSLRVKAEHSENGSLKLSRNFTHNTNMARTQVLSLSRHQGSMMAISKIMQSNAKVFNFTTICINSKTSLTKYDPQLQSKRLIQTYHKQVVIKKLR